MLRRKPCRLVLTEEERRCSFYYDDVSDSMNIDLDWMIKLPFHTVRWAYFQITKNFVRLPEGKYEDAMINLEKWFKSTVFDEKGNLKVRKGGEKK